MAKRIIAGMLGAIAAVGSLLPLGYAFEIFKDFKNPDLSFWPNVLGELVTCSIGLAGLSIGIYFLRFATSGDTHESHGWIKPVLLGAGFFFPGFVFSLPITMLWVARRWPGNDTKTDLTFEFNACVGVAAAIVCTILRLRKRASPVGFRVAE